ncbi:4576_t:CDS:2, partial [Racocetra fulgida]
MTENDKSFIGIEASLSDEENFISISSDDDADYDATINMVNEFLSNFSNANLEVGSSSTSVGKVQGYEDAYVFDSSDDDMGTLPATAPPVQDYVGKGKQRADPIPEGFNFHSNSRYDTHDIQEIQTPQDQNTEVVMSDANNSPSFPNKNSVERNVALFPSQPPNFPDWVTRDIMIPCPLSETQRALISNLILDRKLIQYLSKVSDNDNADADSLIRTKINDALRIIDHEPVEAINGHLFNGPTKRCLGYNSSEIRFSVEKLKMLRYILVQLKSFRLTIGIAASSVTTGLTFESVWNYREKGEITTDTLAECNINISDSSDDEIEGPIKDNVTKQGAKRQTDEAESSWQKRSRPNLDETLTISQLREHILQLDERIKNQDELLKKKDEHIMQQNEHIQKQDERIRKKDDYIQKQDERIRKKDEHIQKQDEHILQQNGMIKQLQEKNSELNCNFQQTGLENRRLNQELSQFRQMTY